jgi:hypothetical protein
MSGIVLVTFRSHDVNGRWTRIRDLKEVLQNFQEKDQRGFWVCRRCRCPREGARALVIRAISIYFARRRSNAEILVRDGRASLTSRTPRLPNTSTAWLGAFGGQ